MNRKEKIEKLLDNVESLVNTRLGYINMGGFNIQEDFINKQIDITRNQIIKYMIF